MDGDKEHISSLKAQGLALLRGNRLGEAKALYTHVCNISPDDVEAWYMLSSVNGMLGDMEEAGNCCRRVIALQPDRGEAYVNLGNVLFHQGKPDEALMQYQKALKINPNHAGAYCNSGNIQKASGHADEAIESYKRAISLQPDNAVAYYNLGTLLRERHQLKEAVDCFQRAVELKADHAEAYNNLGLALKEQGKLSEAKGSFQHALRLKPDLALIHGNLGNVYKSQGELEEALACFQEALRLDPRDAATHNDTGNLLKAMGRIDEATACFQEALRLNPRFAEAQNNLGSLYIYQGRLDEALACLKEALRLNPDLAPIHTNLGNVSRLQGKLEEALAYYREALRLDPRFAAAHSNLLYVLSYHADYDAPALFAEHVRWGEMHGRGPGELLTHGNVPDEERRLRVGYICADFRNHPVGYFIERVIANHDKAKFEACCYSNHAIGDDLTARLRGDTFLWRDIVGQSDQAVARRIREDGIDILVDLAGHTAGNRLLTLALKPAPVQATWIGYIATTGLKAVDYIIADRFVIPPRDEHYYVEQVARLPNSYLCFTPPRFPIEVSPLPALARKAVTFGCFNNTAKLTPEVIAAWAQLLLAVPRSRLFLKSKGFGDETARRHYRSLFGRHGVEAERIEFSGRSPRNELLAAYQEVDIGLDPFPYNGGTTTVEALWMGVPVISLRGDRFVSRVGDSVLSTAGLGEYVADSQDDYIAKAVALASDLPRLAGLRQRLREQLLNSPLCDGQGFTRDLEAAYRTMWKSWCHTQQEP